MYENIRQYLTDSYDWFIIENKKIVDESKKIFESEVWLYENCRKNG